MNSDAVRLISAANCPTSEQQTKNLILVPLYGLPAFKPYAAGSADPACPVLCVDPDVEPDADAEAEADVEPDADAPALVDAASEADPAVLADVDAADEPLLAGDDEVFDDDEHAAITSAKISRTLVRAHPCL